MADFNFFDNLNLIIISFDRYFSTPMYLSVSLILESGDFSQRHSTNGLINTKQLFYFFLFHLCVFEKLFPPPSLTVKSNPVDGFKISLGHFN